MGDADDFDAFYRGTRGRLLLQSYALTGDLAASRSAVHDAFVATWQRWRRVSRLPDPGAWARPRAWAQAERRRSAGRLPVDHDHDGPDHGAAATLGALATLSADERRVVLLHHLAAVPMPELAGEVGLPPERAEQELRTGTAQLALARGVPDTSVRELFDPLAAIVADVHFPRSSIVRRAGTTRRRTHTAIGAIGAIGAVAALVLGASLVTDAGGVPDTLAGRTQAAPATATSTRPEPAASPAADSAPDPALEAGDLLTATQVAARVEGNAWIVRSTDDNTTGDGRVMRCQQERYADPRGAEVLVRRFVSTPAGPREPAVSAVQSAEVSLDATRARDAYRTTLGWFAGCIDPQLQLESTRRVTGVGDQAVLLVLRRWTDPAETLLVGVARTGALTTTVLSTSTSTDGPAFGRAAQLLADAVDGLCTLPGAGACAARTPGLEVTPAMPAGEVPAMLGEFDLPPVTGVREPWVGTEPRRARTNLAATPCDDADFDAAGMTHNLTRTFLIPGADLPAEFGVTETVASMPQSDARGLVRDVRDELSGCSLDQLGTEVEQVEQLAGPRRDLSVWQVTTEVSEQRSVRYLMAVLRSGSAVAQLCLVPSDAVDLAGDAFVDLAYRALDRLAAQPAPGVTG